CRAAAGRTVRRARRDHAPAPERRTAGAVERAGADRGVRHAQRLRGGVLESARSGAQWAARPTDRRPADSVGLSAHTGAAAAAAAAARLACDAIARLRGIPPDILPAPSLVAQTLWNNLDSLLLSGLYTIKITFGALLLALAGGVALASATPPASASSSAPK